MRRRGTIKPGKAQSMVGFIVGILFCIFGIAVVLPSAGLFGLIWTIMAVVITIVNGLNAFTDKGVPTQVVEYEDVSDDSYKINYRYDLDERYESSSRSSGNSNHAYSAKADSTEDIKRRMEAAKEMYDKGMITYDEYEAKKTELLAKL